MEDIDPRGHNLEQLFEMLKMKTLKTSIMHDYDARVREHGHEKAMRKMKNVIERVNQGAVMNESVAKALNICISAHEGQFRRDGVTPYSSHPIAVAEMMCTDNEKIVAYLHDVIEDTAETAKSLLAKGIPVHCVEAIKVLSKTEGINYDKYIFIVSLNPLASKVKIADMFHNMSGAPTDKQKAKYCKALSVLLVDL